MHSQVRLGQQQGTGNAARLAVDIGKNMELLVDHRQLCLHGRVAAQRRERLEFRQENSRAAAIEEITGQVQALHLRPPCRSAQST